MKRLQFLLQDNRLEELDGLVNELGLKSRTDLLNSALSLFEWAVHERQKGRIIVAYDEDADRYKEVVVDGFPPVAPHPAQPRIAARNQDFDRLLYAFILDSLGHWIKESGAGYQILNKISEANPGEQSEAVRILQEAARENRDENGMRPGGHNNER